MVNKVQYNKFICEFYRELNNKNKPYSNLVFLCIGTDRITGDCFGPIVGNRLQKDMQNLRMKPNVYGTLEEPVVASNLKIKINEIYIKYERPFVVAIDAALSKKENIGKIIVSNNLLQAGKALEKNNTKVGNISIKAIVGKKEKNIKKNMEILQNTSLNMVMNLAEIVSNGIMEVLQEE